MFGPFLLVDLACDIKAQTTQKLASPISSYWGLKIELSKAREGMAFPARFGSLGLLPAN